MARGKVTSQLGLDEAVRQRWLDFLELTEKDEVLLAELRDFGRRHVDSFVERFYEHLWRFEGARRFLQNEERVARLKQTQRAYFLQMLEGRFDAEYFESRLAVGDAHQRIDMSPEWYVGAFALYLRFFIDALIAEFGEDRDHLAELLKAVTKVIFLDMSLAITAYIAGGFVQRTLAEQLRHAAETAQRALEEKAELERVKTELTNMIVHDLKGPIGGILTVSQLALRRRGASEEAQLRRFEQIQRSARDLLRMIENLLEIDQMESGRMELRMEEVDLKALLTECAEEYRAAAEIAGQSLSVVAHNDLPVLVTDRWLVRRILNNLVVNAIRHSGSTGRIEIGARWPGDFVELYVSDTGRGIPLEQQPFLFEKTGPRCGGTHREDTGLGLVFCKLASELVGGSIRVESEPGRGATFIVSLPVS